MESVCSDALSVCVQVMESVCRSVWRVCVSVHGGCV